MKSLRKPIVLLDADVICYQMAYGNTTVAKWQNDDGTVTETVNMQPEVALAKIRDFIRDTEEKFRASQVIIALTHRSSNFRKELDPTYKAKRSPKPPLWETTRDYLELGDHGFEVKMAPRLEGDDVLGILQTAGGGGNRVIVSIDKDMQTVPGHLYLWNKPQLGTRYITPREAGLFHLFQTLTGDTTDNYPGLPLCGETKATAILDGAASEAEAWERVVHAYERRDRSPKSKSKLPALTEADALLQARLAHILWDGEYNEQTQKVRLWKPDNRW